MSIKAVREETKEKRSIPAIISDFIISNRKVLLIGIAVLGVAFISFVALTVIQAKATAAIDAKVASYIEEWAEAKSAGDEAALATAEDGLLASLGEITGKGVSSPARARANLLAADIKYSRKDWTGARDGFLAAAADAPSVYTAGIALYNAASCEEELGNADSALALYSKAAADDSFNLKPRAMFNIGRIEEQRSKTKEAIEAYENLVEKYPENSWSLLAKSRLVVLQIQ